MIKKFIILSLFFVIFAVNISAVDVGYLISIQRTNDDLSLKSIELIGGPISNYQPTQGYKAKMLSFQSKELFNYNFTVGQIPFFSGPITEKQYNTSEELITSTFPYYNNAKKIEIFDETGKLKLEIDLSSYARCNENDFCDFNENLATCPEDCRTEVVIEKPQEQITEEVKEQTPTAPEETVQEKTLLNKLEEQGISQNLLIIIAVLTIVLILILVLSRKKENK